MGCGVLGVWPRGLELTRLAGLPDSILLHAQRRADMLRQETEVRAERTVRARMARLLGLVKRDELDEGEGEEVVKLARLLARGV